MSAQMFDRTTRCAVADYGCLQEVASLRTDDLLIYGTSDATVNPGEIWMTKEAVKCTANSWCFFNYPLSHRWAKFDVSRVFAPYPFDYKDPFDSVADMELESGVIQRMQHRGLQQLVAPNDPIRQCKLRELVELIRQKREKKSFCVVNRLDRDNCEEKIFGSSKIKLYKSYYAGVGFGCLLDDPEIKLGGALIYFLVGYAVSRLSCAVMLCPHNVCGDVWGATAAGADMAGCTLRLYQIGGFDLMTSRQWELYSGDKRWRKAPPFVIRQLQQNRFREELYQALVNERMYCAVSYDETRDTFNWELGSPSALA